MSIGEPLRFSPLPMTRVWGGEGLKRFLDESVSWDGPLGEVWQLSDRDGASSVVVEGEFAGRSLRGLMLSEAESILGEHAPSPEGYFPLLIKLLDARDNLSVHVHPDATAAQGLGCGACAKTEAWYILEAGPDSKIYCGLKPGVDATTFAEHAASPDVVELLDVHRVRPGQFIHVPAGTVHAIGAGITLAEIQENSDTTYRMFDWGRVGLDGKPREVHLEQALKAIDYRLDATEPVDVGAGNGCLLDCDAFRVDFVGEDTDQLATGEPAALMVLEGRAQLAWDGTPTTRVLEMGQTWLLPADVGVRQVQGASKIFKALLVRFGSRKQGTGGERG